MVISLPHTPFYPLSQTSISSTLCLIIPELRNQMSLSKASPKCIRGARLSSQYTWELAAQFRAVTRASNSSICTINRQKTQTFLTGWVQLFFFNSISTVFYIRDQQSCPCLCALCSGVPEPKARPTFLLTYLYFPTLFDSIHREIQYHWAYPDMKWQS